MLGGKCVSPVRFTIRTLADRVPRWPLSYTILGAQHQRTKKGGMSVRRSFTIYSLFYSLFLCSFLAGCGGGESSSPPGQSGVMVGLSTNPPLVAAVDPGTTVSAGDFSLNVPAGAAVNSADLFSSTSATAPNRPARP